MPKRVLVIIRSLKLGGMERVAITLSDALADGGHDVHLLYMKKQKVELRPESKKVHLHYVNFDLINRLTIIGYIYDVLTRGVINLFYRKSMFLWRGLYTSLYYKIWLAHIEKKYGKFDLIILRGQGTFEYLWPVQDKRMLQFVENIALEDSPYSKSKVFSTALYHNKRIACVSNGVKNSILAVSKRHNIQPASVEVFFNPCPVKLIQKMSNQLEPDIPDMPYIVNVSRLVPQKNHKLLLEAYALGRFSEKLVIVGEGTEDSSLKKHAKKLGISDDVLFAGSRVNPYPWMKQAKLFVLSSNIEGFGVVLVESLACGTPVVAVDCPGGIRDVLIEELSEYLVSPNAKLLSAKMKEALTSRLKIKSEWVDRFDAKTIAEEIIEKNT